MEKCSHNDIKLIEFVESTTSNFHGLHRIISLLEMTFLIQNSYQYIEISSNMNIRTRDHQQIFIN